MRVSGLIIRHEEPMGDEYASVYLLVKSAEWDDPGRIYLLAGIYPGNYLREHVEAEGYINNLATSVDLTAKVRDQMRQRYGNAHQSQTAPRGLEVLEVADLRGSKDV